MVEADGASAASGAPAGATRHHTETRHNTRARFHILPSFLIRQGEVLKRDQWLKKAKDIITEYQKRSVPGQGGGTPQAACSLTNLLTTHLIALRRTINGPFPIAKCVQLPALIQTIESLAMADN